MSPTKEAIARSRRVFTPGQQATILHRHLADNVPVSDRCDAYQLAPSLLSLWQKQALEHLTAALQKGCTARGALPTARADRARIAALEAIMATKDRVIAEVSEEYLDMQKLWGPMTGCWVPPDQRDAVVDCLRSLHARTAMPVRPMPHQLGIARAKYARWTASYGALAHDLGQRAAVHRA